MRFFWHFWRLRGFDGQSQLIRRHFCCSCLWNSFAWFYKAGIFTLLPFFSPTVSFLMTQSSHHTFLRGSCHGLLCVFYCRMPVRVPLALYNASYLFTVWCVFIHSLHVALSYWTYAKAIYVSFTSVSVSATVLSRYTFCQHGELWVTLRVCIWISTTTLGGPDGYRPDSSFFPLSILVLHLYDMFIEWNEIHIG